MPNPSETVPALLMADPTAIARQAIVDENRAVFGYELFDRSIRAGVHTAATDAEMLFNVLSHADNEVLAGRKMIFINCTHDSLSGGHLELVQPERLVLELPSLDTPDPEEIESRLRAIKDVTRRGFRLAFNHTVLTKAYAPWLPYATFIKFDMALLKPEAVGPFIVYAQEAAKARLVAECCIDDSGQRPRPRYTH